MKKLNDKILILGVGNEILTDDGVGPKIVKRLKQELISTGIKFETAFLGGLDILEYIQGFNTVVFIDAIKTLSGSPGEVYEFSVSDFKETLHLSNLHDISFLTALEMAKKIGYQTPKNIKIIAIEIVEDLVFSESFSPELEHKYDEVFEKVKRKLNYLY